MTTPAIVWFRHDLRLADNPALRKAHESGGAIIPVFIWAPEEEGEWPPGSASRYWLHHSLTALAGDLEQAGSRLIIRQGASGTELDALVGQTGAGAVYWNRRYEPTVMRRDADIETRLRSRGLAVTSCNASLLFEPSHLVNKTGRPFRIFTAFWRQCRTLGEPPRPLPAPRALRPPGRWPHSIALDSLQLEPTVDWAKGIRATWTFGARSARRALCRFLQEDLTSYPQQRDYPGADGVSRLSPRLHFGEISPRQVWHAVRRQEAASGRLTASEHAAAYLRQLGWREFAHYLLFHFPQTSSAPLNEAFQDFPWQWNTEGLHLWRHGRTGYPIVDAGMRELWHTGYMHNRVRMIVASFLVKDLLVHWLEGARWFWDTLVDADLANNALGWQWAAGCGADAAPYFRIFNPVLQAKRVDATGAYIRYWVPELKDLPDTSLPAPWQADRTELKRAGIVLGETYPCPIVDHQQARQRALAALKTIRQRR